MTPEKSHGLLREVVDLPHGNERIRLYKRSLIGDPVNRPVLLMAHGSTYSAVPAFDLPIDGLSVMDALAIAGIETWAIDIVGYGASSRPKGIGQSALLTQPVSRTYDAAKNVETVVKYLNDRYRRSSLALLGWSWGTSVMGSYAASRGNQVSRLIQIAPMWTRLGPSATDPGGRLGSYRTINVSAIRKRWINGLPAETAHRLAPLETVTALELALLAADNSYSSVHPGHICVPNGTIADTRDFWSKGKPLYDAGAITCPVLVIAGAWDQEWPVDTATSYVSALTKARSTQIVVPEATHSLLLEPGRLEIVSSITSYIMET